jgi:hypothetical protein
MIQQCQHLQQPQQEHDLHLIDIFLHKHDEQDIIMQIEQAL